MHTFPLPTLHIYPVYPHCIDHTWVVEYSPDTELEPSTTCTPPFTMQNIIVQLRTALVFHPLQRSLDSTVQSFNLGLDVHKTGNIFYLILYLLNIYSGETVKIHHTICHLYYALSTPHPTSP